MKTIHTLSTTLSAVAERVISYDTVQFRVRRSLTAAQIHFLRAHTRDCIPSVVFDRAHKPIGHSYCLHRSKRHPDRSRQGRAVSIPSQRLRRLAEWLWSNRPVHLSSRSSGCEFGAFPSRERLPVVAMTRKARGDLPSEHAQVVSLRT